MKAPKLTYVRRRGNIALFIDDWNVWDLHPKYVTTDVKEAIKRAFELGVAHAIREVYAAVENPTEFDLDADFKKEVGK